jgi:hypothetical protein
MGSHDTLWRRAGTIGAEHPDERNRYVDLLRAVSITVVVLGHWLMAAPEVSPTGELRAGHVLADLPVDPVAHLGVPGDADLLRGGRLLQRRLVALGPRQGEGYGPWLHARLRRLVLPVLALLGVWTVVAVVAITAGLDPELVKIGSQTALVPVWFLAVYVLVAALAPAALAAWERFGLGLGAGVRRGRRRHRCGVDRNRQRPRGVPQLPVHLGWRPSTRLRLARRPTDRTVAKTLPLAAIGLGRWWCW